MNNSAPPSPGLPAGLQRKSSGKRRPIGRPWQPGVSGNPSGRRRGALSPTAALRRALTKRDLEQIARKVVSLAKRGDRHALRLIFERLDGLVVPPSPASPADAGTPIIAQFTIPDNGRDPRPVERLSNAELDAIIADGIRQGYLPSRKVEAPAPGDADEPGGDSGSGSLDTPMVA